MLKQGKQLNAQRGLTFTGFLLNCVLIGFAALIGMRLFPLYSESFRVSTALREIAAMPDIALKSSRDIQSALLRRFEIDDVRRFNSDNLGDSLVIKPNGRGMRTMTMAYEMRGPLLGNLDIVLKYDESRTVAGTTSE